MQFNDKKTGQHAKHILDFNTLTEEGAELVSTEYRGVNDKSIQVVYKENFSHTEFTFQIIHIHCKGCENQWTALTNGTSYKTKFDVKLKMKATGQIIIKKIVCLKCKRIYIMG